MTDETNDGDDNVVHLDIPQPPSKSDQRREGDAQFGTSGKKPRVKGQIPELERRPVDPDTLVKPDQRAVACVNMKLAGAPFHAIAKELDYASPAAAEQAYVSALASMYPVETWESLRQIETMRAEQLFAQSFAMSQADYLIIHDEDGNEIRVPNTEKRQWHEQAGKDLIMHATITGAKAPARVEVSASTQELNQMVEIILHQNAGGRSQEANIFDIDDYPQGIEDAEEVEDDGPEG